MKKQVLEEDFLAAEQLGLRPPTMAAWAPHLCSGAAALATYGTWQSQSAAVVCAALTFVLVFLWNAKAPNPASYCPERRCPPSHWFLGHAPQIMANLTRINEWYVEMFEKHGNGFVATAPRGVVSYFYRDPATVKHVTKDQFHNYVKGAQIFNTTKDLFGHGIFFVDGKLWRSQRKTASSLFTMRFLRDFTTEVFSTHIKQLCDRLDAFAESGEEVDLSSMFFRLTLDAFVEMAFGVDLGCVASYPEPVAFADAFDSAQSGVTERFWRPWWRLERLLGLGKEGQLANNLKVIDDFALRIIRQRRQVKDSELDARPDLLSRFMAAARKGENSDRLLSDAYLRDLVLSFVIAGRDTTAQTLSWLFYELNLQPQAADGVVQESQQLAAVAEQGGDALYRVLNDMPYTHAIISETLRLHPPVPRQAKVALNDDVLPDGTKVRAGDMVRMCNYAMGRNTDVWGDDAKEFKPTRFLDDCGAFVNMDAFKFFSFNAGPRVCLGKPMAYLEAKMAASTLLHRFEVHVTPGQELTYGVSFTLPIQGNRGGMHATLRKRV